MQRKVYLPALSATSSLGTLTTTQATVADLDGLGLTATTTLNDDKLIFKYYGDLSPNTSASYTDKTPNTSATYVDKTPA